MLEDIADVDGMFEHDTPILSARITSTAWGSLTPSERGLISQAVPKRRSEFATGRSLAKRALWRLGVPATEILQHWNRAPIWPRNVSGSISHCHTRAFVAVGRTSEVGTIGVDAEDLGRLHEDLWPSVLTAAELQQLQKYCAEDRSNAALIQFSAKESLYKAQYPRTETFMEFSDLRVELSSSVAAEVGTFSCIFEGPVGPFRAGAAFPGRFRILSAYGVVLTAVSISDHQAR